MDKQLKMLILIYFICGAHVLRLIISRIFNPLNKDKKKEEKRASETSFTTRLRQLHSVLYPETGIFWELTHFIMYFFLGYFAPNYWYLSITIGYLFEHLELYLNKDHDIPIYPAFKRDMVTNSFGLLGGIVTRFS
tara:strand:- start:752 stop:1156 length:405 start_codon:yes stop_codon:yes gene_type:complete